MQNFDFLMALKTLFSNFSEPETIYLIVENIKKVSIEEAVQR